MSSFSERLVRFSMRNTLSLVLGSLIWMGAAVWCYFSLPIDLLPNLNFPTLSVVVEDPGLTAEELERQVTIPVESAMAGITNISKVRSATVANLALITVQLNWGADLEVARQQVLQKIATVQTELPPGSSIALESLSNTLGQVEAFMISGDQSLIELHDFAEYKLRPLLLQQPGVFQVLIFGGMVQEYAVFVRPSKLEQFDLTIRDVQDALVRNNIASPGGILDLGSQSFAVIAQTKLTDQASIAGTLVAVKNGVPVRIRDVGRVALSHLPYRGGAETNAKPGVVIQLIKQPQADTVAIARNTDRFMERARATFPPGVSVTKYYDQSEMVIDSIRGVEEAVVLGALLVGIILLVFLRSWRAAFVAFTSIPASLLSALIFFRMFGMSLNIMTLSALAIATGMVIDDAIVVIENVFRHRALSPGKPIAEIFVEATIEVAGPVASSTITTVAIFVPLIFLPELAGRLFSPVGVVVSIVMMASLVFALTLIPSIGPLLLTEPPRKEKEGFLSRAYKNALDHALRLRWALAAIVLVLCVASFVVLNRLNREFLPLLDEGSLLMRLDAPPGSSLDETVRAERLAIKEIFHDPDIENVVATTGHAPGTQDTDSMNHSDITAKLVAKNKRKRPVEALFKDFRERAKNFPGVLIDFTMPYQDKLNDATAGVSETIGVKIFGEDLDKLQGFAGQLASKMSSLKGVVDLRPGAIVPIPAVTVSLLPDKADSFGVTRSDLSDIVQAMSYGVEATGVRQLHKQVPLTIRMEGTDDNVPTLRVDQLKQVPIRTADGPYIPLSQVAEVKFGVVPSLIEHEHAMRVVTVSCNVTGVKNQTIIQGIDKIFGEMKMPEGYSYEIAGSYTAQTDATRSMTDIGIVALVLVTAILWIEFASVRKTLLVLLTIPLSTIGASFALWVTGQTLNISSLIGLVMLVGVVLRNGIVLIDYIHLSIEKGMPLNEAIETGAQVRFRPIVMTALSEILGLLPLAIGMGAGSALEKPLAVAVIGGLITSTFLTLFVLPIGYRILYRE